MRSVLPYDPCLSIRPHPTSIEACTCHSSCDSENDAYRTGNRQGDDVHQVGRPLRYGGGHGSLIRTVSRGGRVLHSTLSREHRGGCGWSRTTDVRPRPPVHLPYRLERLRPFASPRRTERMEAPPPAKTPWDGDRPLLLPDPRLVVRRSSEAVSGKPGDKGSVAQRILFPILGGWWGGLAPRMLPSPVLERGTAPVLSTETNGVAAFPGF